MAGGILALPVRVWHGGSRRTSLTCAHCGVQFTRYASKACRGKTSYCCREHQIAARSGAANPNWRGGNINRLCVVCSTEFAVFPATLKVRPAKFCSPECKAKGTSLYPTRQIAHREHGRRREARKKGAVGSHTHQQWVDLLAIHDGKCLHCGTTQGICRDHIIPLSLGGGDNIENIQPLCRPCNSHKGNRI